MIKVSVIMPVYNVEDFVEASILSIQQQEFQDWELIVVNDGSTDHTESVVQKLICQDARIRLINQKNQGVSAARNNGIKAARGEFISFLDGDDLWKPEFLARMLTCQAAKDQDIIFCGYESLLPDGRIKTLDNYFCDEDVLYYYAKLKFKTHIGAVLIKKTRLEEYDLSFTEGCSFGEDVEFLYKALTVLEAGVVKDSLMIYRKRAGSASRSAWDPDKFFTSIKAFERIRSFLEQHREKHDGSIVSVMPLILNLIAYTKSDYLWKSLKLGNFEMVKNLLSAGWNEAIKMILNSEDVKLSKKIKYRIVLSENIILWNAIHTCSKKI